MLKEISCFLCICLVSIQPLLASEAILTDSVTQLNDAEFENFIQSADKPIVIDFWAPWCGPCRNMKPIFEELANELNEEYLFVSVNVDEGQQIAKEYGISSIPTFKIVKNGTVIETFVGSISKERLKEKIDNAVHNKITIETLISAIQSDDKNLVVKCLSNKDLDVNGITQFNVMSFDMQMTPLMMAVSQVLYGQSSPEIVTILLNSGAKMDLEIDSPELDKSMAVIGSIKVTARIIVEQTAKGISEKDFAAIGDETIRQRVLETKAKALNLLELFQAASES